MVFRCTNKAAIQHASSFPNREQCSVPRAGRACTSSRLHTESCESKFYDSSILVQAQYLKIDNKSWNLEQHNTLRANLALYILHLDYLSRFLFFFFRFISSAVALLVRMSMRMMTFFWCFASSTTWRLHRECSHCHGNIVADRLWFNCSLEPRPSSPPDLRPSGRGPGKTSILFRVVPHYSGEHFPL